MPHRKVAFIDQDTKYYAGGFMGIIRTSTSRCLPQYLFFYLLKSLKYREEIKLLTQGANINNISSTINSIKIPLPSVEVQQKIVDELDGYRKIIFGAQSIVSNYEPHLPKFKTGNIVKLSDICEINRFSVNPEREYGEESFTYIDISSVTSGTGKVDTSQKIKGKDAPSRARRGMNKGDILMSTVRPNLKAFSYVDFDTKGFVASTGFAVLTPKNVNGKYLLYALLDDFVGNQLSDAMSKAMYPSVNKSDLENLDIICPSIEEQNEAVIQIERELSFIKSSEEIVSIFTKKIEQKINEVWGE